MFQAFDLRLFKVGYEYIMHTEMKREREKRKSDSQQKFQFYYVFSFFSVRPLKVEILNSNNPFSADRKYEIPCQTFGSRPPADISWWLDGKQLIPPRYNHTQQVNNKVDNNFAGLF